MFVVFVGALTVFLIIGIQFGLGLEYDNEWILNASNKTTISSINDDLPESEFSVTLHNDNQIFNVDNPASEINFLESGQRLNVTIGYQLDNGSIEWLQMGSLYVYEWSASDEKATIRAVDVLKFIDDDYYKGQYYENGITLYDLAVLVLTDAGVGNDDYYLDTYLKKVIIHNPLPKVKHKEALQIIANAGRCVLDYDRYGRIRIHSLFQPSMETTSNGTTYKEEENGFILSNDGSVYVEPEPEPEPTPEPYEPTLEDSQEAKVAEMNMAQQGIIATGVDVVLTDGTTEHFTLEDHDQTSLVGLQSQVAAGEENIPWHTSNEAEHCKFYSNKDMKKITATAMAYVTWHVTYFRDLRIYIRSLESKEDVEKVTYGMDIPEAYQSEPLKAMMAQKS